ncbi:MAG: hypothetical protein ACKEQK_00110 [Candidatus Hodgkinia cicadicola]
MNNKVKSFCKTIAKITKTNQETPFNKGDLVIGNVIYKWDNLALVKVGSYVAVLPNNGSWSFGNLCVGDWLEVYIEWIDEMDMIISRRNLDINDLWERLDTLCKNKEEIEGIIISFTRRGVKMDINGLFGVIYWTEDLIKLENELRKRATLMVHVRALCREHNMIVLSPSREIEDRDQRRPKSLVWVMLVDLCDIGVLTVVDGCNGIIILNGKPWCNALGFLNRLQFGKLCLGTFAKLGRGVKVEQTEDCVDLIVNFVLEAEKGLKWDRNVIGIGIILVLEWVLSLALEERERWWDWRESGNCNYVIGRFILPKGLRRSEREIVDVNIKQNLLWEIERYELEDLACGFDCRRFELIISILGMVKYDQLDDEDREWLKKVKGAWLIGGEGTLIKSRAQYTKRITYRNEGYASNNLQKVAVNKIWRPEIDWGDKQDLRDEGKSIIIAGQVVKIKEIVKEKIHSNNKSIQTCSNDIIDEDLLQVKPEVEDLEYTEDIDWKLDDEWEEEWYLERELNYWQNQYNETKCCSIETRSGNWGNMRILRSVYGVIVGMDVNIGMLVVAICNTILAYICDFSLTDEDVTLLEGDWKNDLALKVIPVGFSYGLDDVMVEVDVEGYRYLRFVNESWGKVIVGDIAKVMETEVIVILEEGICGKLRFDGSTDGVGMEVGMTVDVSVVDFNPATNDINLELSEDEEVRTLLVEV